MYPECKLDAAGSGYRGTLSVTTSGNDCILWEGVGISEEENYCRNPASDTKATPWCYYSDSEWELCDVPECEGEYCISINQVLH